MPFGRSLGELRRCCAQRRVLKPLPPSDASLGCARIVCRRCCARCADVRGAQPCFVCHSHHLYSTNEKRTGVVAPETFLKRLRATNELFRTPQQQDAHEFLNYLLNELDRAANIIQSNSYDDEDDDDDDGADADANDNDESRRVARSFVQELFRGTLTNETRCLCCETVTSRDEPFLDLSVDVTQNSSISHCFDNFCSAGEIQWRLVACVLSVPALQNEWRATTSFSATLATHYKRLPNHSTSRKRPNCLSFR